MNKAQYTPKTLFKLSPFNIFSKMEVAELPKILMPHEQVLGIISGFYSVGTATLCVTSRRLLLIDKKLLRMSYEDIRFEAISEVNFSQQLLLASVKFYFAGRQVQFRSWYRRELRTLAQFTQNKMFEARQHGGVLSGDFGNLAPIYKQLSGVEEGKSEGLNQASKMPEQTHRHLAKWHKASSFIEELALASSQKEPSNTATR